MKLKLDQHIELPHKLDELFYVYDKLINRKGLVKSTILGRTSKTMLSESTNYVLLHSIRAN